MANYASLKEAIQDVIKTNGNNEITGSLLQQSLLAMINSLGVGYQYVGIATPATNPGTPDQNVFYLASTAGTYANFGGFVLADGEIAILKYNGAWSKDSTGAASLEKVNQLDQIVNLLNIELNGGNAYVPVQLTLKNGYYNTQVGSEPYTIQATVTQFADYKCAELQVAPGEHFKISGDNYGVNIQRLWAFADADNNRLTYADNTWHQSTMLVDEEIVAPANAVRLVVNFRNYDASTCGLKKLQNLGGGIAADVEGLMERVEELEEHDVNVVDSLDSESTTDALSAKQGKVLNGMINGTQSYIDLDIQGLIEQGKYYNTQVGQEPYKVQSNSVSDSGLGITCLKLSVIAGEKYKLFGKGYPTGNVLRIFAIAGDENVRLDVAEMGADYSAGHEITIPAGASFMVINFHNYNSVTDKLQKYVSIAGINERINDCEQAIEVLANSKPYDGKTILCLGDSITEGIVKIAEPYPYYLQQLLGGNVINCGVGGTRCTARTAITPTTTSGAYAAFDFVNLAQAIGNNNYTELISCGEYLRDNANATTPLAVANRLAQIDWSKIDFIVVAYGVNDWVNGVLLGDITDGNEGELVPKYSDTEFCGAWNKGLHSILSTYPHIKIVIMTNPVGYRTDEPYSSSFRAARWGSNYKLNNGATLEGYANATIEIARYNTLPVYDFYHNCGWNRDNFAKYYLQSDGVTVNTIHPASGYDYLAHKLASWMLSQWE